MMGVGLGACGGDDRPTVADWQAEWLIDRSLVPTEDQVVSGGKELCDELVGEFRDEFGGLTPSPVESLDATVEDWVQLTESLVFDCPHDDESDLAHRYAEIQILNDEIVAGIRSINSD